MTKIAKKIEEYVLGTKPSLFSQYANLYENFAKESAKEMSTEELKDSHSIAMARFMWRAFSWADNHSEDIPESMRNLLMGLNDCSTVGKNGFLNSVITNAEHSKSIEAFFKELNIYNIRHLKDKVSLDKFYFDFVEKGLAISPKKHFFNEDVVADIQNELPDEKRSNLINIIVSGSEGKGR